MYKKHKIKPQNYKVAVLCGGNSSERGVSISSGTGVHKALVDSGFDVGVLDPSKKEDWIKLFTSDFDIVFNALHGKFGEDGTMQSILEMLDMPYTGPGVYACKTSMNKNVSKILYNAAEIPAPKSFCLFRGDKISFNECVEKVGAKFIIKPATEGSSVGAHIVTEEFQFLPMLEDAFIYDDELVVESFIEGREFAVSVLGNDDPRALPVIEIVPKSAFYDFVSKYEEGGAEHICPAELPEKITELIQHAALSAHMVLKANGVSRSDVLMDQNENIYVLETNAIPGMTPTSLLPDAARASGLSYEELCTEMVYLGLEIFGKI
ncbi:MAG: D-alanine--D-alanine ligase [Eggerthellaceae bacterium]|nr:D-alanine--D-alanine ligase [Eggerthellaceae bacterium]